jgi:ABC-type multidrug transport system permease subunit
MDKKINKLVNILMVISAILLILSSVLGIMNYVSFDVFWIVLIFTSALGLIDHFIVKKKLITK